MISTNLVRRCVDNVRVSDIGERASRDFIQQRIAWELARHDGLTA
jgi:hypothetical protein